MLKYQDFLVNLCPIDKLHMGCLWQIIAFFSDCYRLQLVDVKSLQGGSKSWRKTKARGLWGWSTLARQKPCDLSHEKVRGGSAKSGRCYLTISPPSLPFLIRSSGKSQRQSLEEGVKNCKLWTVTFLQEPPAAISYSQELLAIFWNLSRMKTWVL